MRYHLHALWSAVCHGANGTLRVLWPYLCVRYTCKRLYNWNSNSKLNIRWIWRKMRIKRIPVYGRTNMSQLGEQRTHSRSVCALEIAIAIQMRKLSNFARNKNMLSFIPKPNEWLYYPQYCYRTYDVGNGNWIGNCSSTARQRFISRNTHRTKSECGQQLVQSVFFDVVSSTAEYPPHFTFHTLGTTRLHETLVASCK